MREESAVMTIVVHVNGIFTVGEKARCGQFGRGLDRVVLVKNLGELILVLGASLRDISGEQV